MLVLSPFVLLPLLFVIYYEIKSFLIISNFLEKNMVIGIRILDDKRIMEYVRGVLQSLDSRLTYHRS